MTQAQRLDYLIKQLIQEKEAYNAIKIPEKTQDRKALLRALLNVREPAPAPDEFLKIQDEYLKTALSEKGITSMKDFIWTPEEMCVWKGDITVLKAEAVVNAANSGMLGCFIPCHGCIDNAIHTYAGVQLRYACHELMRRQGYPEPVGRAKITPAFNLPSRYIIHTVGPMIQETLTEKACEQLSDCYQSCLELAEENNIASIAFCCISTGEFHFPNRRAAEIAVQTVKAYKKNTKSRIRVIFNVFKENDWRIYNDLLSADQTAQTRA